MFPKIKPNIYKGFMVAIILVLVVAGLGVVTQPASAASKNCAQKHIVQRGESLIMISLQFGVPWQTIAQLNHLSSPYRLVSGERLCISTTTTTSTGTGTGGSTTPNTGGTTSGGTTTTGTGGATLPSTGGTGTQSAACSSSYKVVSGDSLFRIGQRFGVTWQSLAVANRIKRPFRVFVGQTLCIPSRTSSTGTNTGTSSGTGTTGNNTTSGTSTGTGGGSNNMGGGGSQSGGGQSTPGYTNP